MSMLFRFLLTPYFLGVRAEDGDGEVKGRVPFPVRFVVWVLEEIGKEVRHSLSPHNRWYNDGHAEEWRGKETEALTAEEVEKLWDKYQQEAAYACPHFPFTGPLGPSPGQVAEVQSHLREILEYLSQLGEMKAVEEEVALLHDRIRAPKS